MKASFSLACAVVVTACVASYVRGDEAPVAATTAPTYTNPFVVGAGFKLSNAIGAEFAVSADMCSPPPRATTQSATQPADEE